MQLVTIVIPAYNAAATLEETLRSAAGQTHPECEIIVVDDGSTDATPGIVHRLAAEFAQIRIVTQQNQGLASARNRGIAEAQGRYVAPLDADDLWHPDKIALQVAALKADPAAALAYGWFRNVDAQSRVLPGSASPTVSGSVFYRHLDWNFISNGSTPLVRSEVARDVLYDRRADGCEDYMFQLQVARRHRFACVPAWVTGYRRVGGSMSTQVGRMIRGHLRMFAILEAQAGPAERKLIRRQVSRLEIELARNRGRRGAIGEAAGSIGRGVVADPLVAARTAGREIVRAATGAHRRIFPAPTRPFDAYAADEPDGSWSNDRPAALDAWLAELDASGPPG